MYVLRRHIRGDLTIEDGYKDVENKLGDGPTLLLDEALLAKDLDDGRGLLAFSAKWGREKWFLHCLKRIRRSVRHCVRSMKLKKKKFA